MSHVEITQPDPETGGTRVVVDGADLSMSLSGAVVEFNGADPARVTLSLALYQDQRLCMADAVLVIDEASADLLERHGWTRPGGTS